MPGHDKINSNHSGWSGRIRFIEPNKFGYTNLVVKLQPPKIQVVFL